MWILSLLPESFLLPIINGILFLGMLSTIASILFKYILKWIPGSLPYRTALYVISIALLVVGVYLRGGYDTELKWRARVAEAEEQVRIAENKAKEVNVKIQTKIVEKIKVVIDQRIVIEEKIRIVEKKIDATCTVDEEAIALLNEAAKLPEAK